MRNIYDYGGNLQNEYFIEVKQKREMNKLLIGLVIGLVIEIVAVSCWILYELTIPAGD